MNSIFNKALVVAALSTALAAPALAGGGWGSGDWTSPNIEGSGSWFAAGSSAGFTQGEAMGFGKYVETYAQSFEDMNMVMSGNMQADPNCAGDCGNMTFGVNFLGLQSTQTGASAFDYGAGQANAGVRTDSVGNMSFTGQFEFSLPAAGYDGGM